MYNKLYTKILDSSIWLEPNPTRIVWITFLAAMDEDGFAQFSSVRNLANRAMVTPEEAQAAVETLERPDTESANKDHDGRRIERVPGGWMVLNANLYRDIVTRTEKLRLNRERVARHRAKKARNAAGNAPVMQSYAGSEAISESKSAPPVHRARKRCPEDFVIPEEAIEKIRAECPAVNIEFETRRFRDYEFATGKSDWLAVWRNWMRKAQESVSRSRAVRPTRYDQLMQIATAPPADQSPSELSQFLLGSRQ